MSIRRKLAAAGLTLVVTCAGLLGNSLLGALPATPRQEKDVMTALQRDDKEGPTKIYYGTAACTNKGCHGGDPLQKWVVGRDLITRNTEANVYSMHDKHGDAFKVLKGKRGQQMAKILGYDVTKAKACLTCHSTYVEDPSLLQASKELYFDPEEGVTCVTCHGAYSEWIGAHAVLVTARKFRQLTPEQKEKFYG